MKTAFTFFLSLCLLVSAFAADNGSNITVSFAGNSNYKVIIDGRPYEQRGQRIYLNSIRPGRHNIKVYSLSRNYKQMSRPAYASSFTLRPQYDMFIEIGYNGAVQFRERMNIVEDGKNKNWKNGHYKKEKYGKNDRIGNNDSGDRYDNRNDTYYGKGYNGGKPTYNRGVSENELNRIIDNMNRQWYNKRSIAADAINRNYFTTRQVEIILMQFSADSEKLEIAKLAFSNTIDQQNYYQLYHVFTYENSRDALERFVRSHR